MIDLILKKSQKTEALNRMECLGLHENSISEFLKEDKINLSESVGILYWLNEDEEKMVRSWEQDTENLVYHVIKTNTEYGLLYSFLYVSKEKEEWELDNEDLKNYTPIVYVKNITDDYCSEYGSIMVKPSIGGLVRVA